MYRQDNKGKIAQLSSLSCHSPRGACKIALEHLTDLCCSDRRE